MGNSIPSGWSEAIYNAKPVQAKGQVGYQCEIEHEGYQYTLTYLPSKGEPATRSYAVEQLKVQAKNIIGLSEKSWDEGMRSLEVDFAENQIYGSYEVDGALQKETLGKHLLNKLKNQRVVANIEGELKGVMREMKSVANSVLASGSTEALNAEPIVSSPVMDQINTLKKTIRGNYRGLEQNEQSFMKASLDAYANAWNDIYKKDGVQVRGELYLNLEDAQKDYLMKRDEKFAEIKKGNAQLAQLWNHNRDDPAVSSYIQKAINEINQLASTGTTHTSDKVVKSQLANFQAVVEKKIKIRELTQKQDLNDNENALLDLLTEKVSDKQKLKIKKRLKIEQAKAEKAEGKELKKSLKRMIKYESQLSGEPTSNEMNMWKDNLERRIYEKPEILNTDEGATWALKVPKELSWGHDFLGRSLAQPSNWIGHRSAIILKSKNNLAHVSVTEMDPQNIKPYSYDHQEVGGVPSPMRENFEYRHRPANLMRTNTYLLDAGGEIKPHTYASSFRGGQFPTVEAAKEALKTILSTNPSDLHVNAVLTPTTFTFFKKDLKLLKAHRQNIAKALNELIKEPPNGVSKEQVARLKERLALSNIGVNEGAVGELRKMGIKAPPIGWHSSVTQTNMAVSQLSQMINVKLEDPNVNLFDRLGAIVQVGQEMEAIWAQNDFAKASIGDNQFKLASNWKVMDRLLGVTDYVNCMSGKDRTSEVESNANYMINEILMNIEDHRMKLNDAINHHPKVDQVTEALRSGLTTACLSEADVQVILDSSKPAETLQMTLNHYLERAKYALGLKDGDRGFMQPKRVIGRRILPGCIGISTNEPLKSTKEAVLFPQMMPTSVYDAASSSRERHREAVNRRLVLRSSGGIEVTQINTGVPGFKVEGGRPLARLCSGFDRDYVLQELQRGFTSQRAKELLGLDELDEATRSGILDQLENAPESLEFMLGIVEDYKLDTLVPQVTVSS